MAVLLKQKRVARFGLFRVDLDTGELWKSGERVHIQDQPFRMLELLLEADGLVSRDDLKAKLWPDQTLVTEAALNTCATRLRVALDDTSELHHFVETVARRGYRFVAPIDCSAPPDEPGVKELFQPAHETPDGAVADVTLRPRASTVALVAVVVGAAALFLAFLGVVLLWQHLTH